MAIAALITWVVTAGFGFFMLGTWIASGGARAGSGTASNFRPPVVFGHFLLAAAGLVLWIVYLFVDHTVLAWVAFADLVVVAVLGDTLVLRWMKDHRAITTQSAATTTRPSGGSRAGTDTLTGRVAAGQLAEQRIPTPAVVLHGLFAVATIVLVLLSALEIGS